MDNGEQQVQDNVEGLKNKNQELLNELKTLKNEFNSLKEVTGATKKDEVSSLVATLKKDNEELRGVLQVKNEELGSLKTQFETFHEAYKQEKREKIVKDAENKVLESLVKEGINEKGIALMKPVVLGAVTIDEDGSVYRKEGDARISVDDYIKKLASEYDVFKVAANAKPGSNAGTSQKPQAQQRTLSSVLEFAKQQKK